MTSVVYFLRGEETGAIKIGLTTRLSTRLSNIETSSSEPLKLIGAVEGDAILEKTLQLEFASDRIRREWFKPSEALLARIAALLEDGAITEVGVTRPPEPSDDPHTQRALGWLIAIEKGEYLRRGCRADITRKELARRIKCTVSWMNNLRYGRKRSPISVRDYEALRAAYSDELKAQTYDMREMMKHVPAHIAASAEAQLAAARKILSGE